MIVMQSVSFTLCLSHTDLAIALEDGNYQEACELITRNASDAQYMNEGLYERTPLYIVLCGKSSFNEPQQRNLQVAEILVRHGADPFRTLYGEDSHSPIELVLLLYKECCQECDSFWDVIGLGGDICSSSHDLKDQLLELLDLFLETYEVSEPYINQYVIHDAIVASKSLVLLQKLTEAGVKVASCKDKHGATILASLCEKLRTSCIDVSDMVLYLLMQTNNDVNAVDCRGRSPLWWSLLGLQLDVSLLLLKAGADPFESGLAHIPFSKELDVYVEKSIPALLMCLFREVHTEENDFKRAVTKDALLRKLSFFVDSGCSKSIYHTDCAAAFGSLLKLNWLDTHATAVHSKLVTLPFGSVAAGLQQLCARKIFQTLLQNQQKNKSVLQWLAEPAVPTEDVYSELLPEAISLHKVTVSVADSEEMALNNINTQISNTTPNGSSQDSEIATNDKEKSSNTVSHYCPSMFLENILKELNLPLKFCPLFDTEAFRWKVSTLLYHGEINGGPCDCEESSDSGSSFSDDSSSFSDDSSLFSEESHESTDL